MTLALQDLSSEGSGDSGAKEIRAGLAALAIFFVGFGGWAAITPLDAAVVAQGYVVVSGNRQTVQHRDGGVVARLLVSEGERVEQGQVLIELGAPELFAQEQALLSQVLDLQMQRASLAAEHRAARELIRPAEWASLPPEDLAAADAAFERHQREASRSTWSSFEARIGGYRGEIAALDTQETLVGEELVGIRELVQKQLVSLTRVRALERDLAQIQGRRAELTASIAATQQERFQMLRDVEAKLAELTPQLTGVRERMKLTQLRAPAAGRVVGLNVHPVGGVVRAGEPILDIVPDGQELVVEAQLRPQDADNVNVGQRTEVRITAFTGRNLAILHGEIRQVSADRLTDQRSGEAYFVAQVAVSASELESLFQDSGLELRAGLPAEIIVPTRKRTALQYLLDPINQSMWRSFREE